MKKILLGLMTLFSTVALADDFHLYVVDATNNKTSYNVNDIQKITFSDGNIVIDTNNGSTSHYAISTLQQFYLDTPTADGIESNLTDATAYPVWANQQITIQGTFARAELYNANGMTLGQLHAGQPATFDTADLPAGIYLVRIDGKSYKIMKQ